mmetsp:Transcript_58807/g.137725  ORF Transcript_58807/g.137725 Transcript_58807/m.137725 type:complete len:242 (-) Transcript_58807:1287-2012(-)
MREGARRDASPIRTKGFPLLLQRLHQIPNLEIHVVALTIDADEAKVLVSVVRFDSADKLTARNDLLLHLGRVAFPPSFSTIVVVHWPHGHVRIHIWIIIPSLAPAFRSQHVWRDATRRGSVTCQDNFSRLPSAVSLGIDCEPHHGSHRTHVFTSFLRVVAHVAALEVDVNGVAGDIDETEALLVVEAPDHASKLHSIEHVHSSFEDGHIPGIPPAICPCFDAAHDHASAHAGAAHKHEQAL